MFYRFYIELNKPNSFAARHSIFHDLENPRAAAYLNSDELPDFDPDFGELLLTDDSSLVDFVDDGSAIGGLGMIVSEKALSILMKLKLPTHRFYPLVTSYRAQTILDKYFWLQIISVPYHSWINFQESVFLLTNQMDFDGPGDEIIISNADEFETIIHRLSADDLELTFSKLAFNQTYLDVDYDIYYLDGLDGVRAAFPIISERFKKSLETNGLVGYQLSSVPLEVRIVL